MMWLRCIGLVGVLIWTIQINAQSVTETNAQIKFLNESIHGALIVHRIYESYNQDLNQYIDRPSHQLNDYSNSDLPSDVFDDPEQWFYPIAPRQLYQNLKLNNSLSKNNQAIKSVWQTCQLLNTKRLTIGDFIAQNDLNQVSNLGTLYQELEGITAAFKKLKRNISVYEENLRPQISNVKLRPDRQQVYTAIYEIHYDLKEVLRLIATGSQSGVIARISKIDKERKWLRTCIDQISEKQEQTDLSKVANLISTTVDYVEEYIHNADVPNEYQTYGKSYYYHNVPLLTNVNRYGNGYVSEINHLMDEYGWGSLHFIEEPHYFMTLYPQLTPKNVLSRPLEPQTTLEELRKSKEQKAKPTVKKSDGFFVGKKTEDKPKPPANAKPQLPPIEIVDVRTLYVDSAKFGLQLYDHKIKDGDRISINVNGVWEYHDISIEEDPKIIVLNVQSGDNYIIIQALNDGWRPPNTIGIRYRSGGKVESQLMKIDLKPTEAVRINYILR